jgi:hypothetical protein
MRLWRTQIALMSGMVGGTNVSQLTPNRHKHSPMPITPQMSARVQVSRTELDRLVGMSHGRLRGLILIPRQAMLAASRNVAADEREKEK